jgi:MoaA/NifB/PqqE/SkfB family radical SAM enzyme
LKEDRMAVGEHLPGGVKLVFELTDLCNFNCAHCLRDEAGHKAAEAAGSHFLPVATIARVLEAARPYGMVDNVALTGGEPTLHPELAAIVKLIADAGYPFDLLTNGWGFARALPALLAVKPFVRAVTFSLDGAIETTHDAIRRREGSFRQVLDRIMQCRHYGLDVQINMTVTRTNRNELLEMGLLASRLGCSAVGYAHCQPTPDALAAGLVMTVEERRQVEADIADIQQQLKLAVYLAGDHFSRSLFVQCPQLNLRELNVDYRGFLTACCQLSNYRGGTPDTDVLADLNRVSFSEGLAELVDRIGALNREKIARVRSGEATQADHFICSHCLKHYGKVPGLDAILLRSTGDGGKE